MRNTVRILLLLVLGSTCFAQSSYRGLRPGKTTRAEVESVIGNPVKRLSATFFEYKEAYDPNNPVRPNKIFVQYREESPSAVVARIELVCDRPLQSEGRDVCSNVFLRSGEFARLPKRGREYASILEKESSGIFKTTAYYGPPSFEVRTWSRFENETYQSRLALYSAELFESAVPRNCTGTFLGEWETNRGRLILRANPGTHPDNWDVDDTNGEYSINKGTVTGHSRNSSTLTGEWKDATGTGTFQLKINYGSAFEPTWPDPRKTFTGTWERKTGKGPKNGTWEGRCVETTQ